MARPKPPAWSPQELAILADVFPREGVNGAAGALPNRSWRAINVMASRLGLRSPVVGDAPKPMLQGAELEEAIRRREVEGWSFARIGATFGVAEASACNAVLIALCPRKGFTPAQRDGHGRLTPEGLERLRLMLRKGLKGVDIQLRLGLSASCIAEQRRRYRADLKVRGKAALPPPGAGEAYSGVKLSTAKKREVEALFMQGYGTAKISARTGVSKTSVTRIRTRLVKRLLRKGEALPGCDAKGVRRRQKDSARAIPAEAINAMRERLLAREPVRRAARDLGIGGSAAYRIRDALAAELAAAGGELPKPILPGKGHDGFVAVRRAEWLPAAKLQRYRDLTREHGLEHAKRLVLDEIAAEQRARVARPMTFEEQLARVAAGAKLAPVVKLRRPDPTMTLGGVSTGAL